VTYHLYGVRLHSAWALPYSRAVQPFVADVHLTPRAAAYFAPARAEAATQPQWLTPIVQGLLADGRTYLQWPSCFEFLISADGRRIAARSLDAGTPEGFQSHLLGPALSFALIRQGLDPLHATAITVAGHAAAFLGDSGFGKSSLAASFLAAGHRLLTDDLLVLTEAPTGFAAHPGPPRLKLYPQTARRLLPGAQGARMMRGTPKLLFPLESTQLASGPIPLRAMYVIVAPVTGSGPSRVTIRRLRERHACLALIRNTFNASAVDRDRLTRQLALTAGVAASVPIKSISYPRSFARLPDVRDAILADLHREAAAVES
jgi:hypothetical protein